jgi:uncharacterized membrane protein
VAEPARPVPTFTIAEAVTYSWNACWRNFGSIIAVSAIVFVGNALVLLIDAANPSAAMSLAFSVLAGLIELLLVFGLVRAALDLVDGRRPTLGEVFRPDGAGPFLVASVVYLVGVYFGLVVFVVPGVIFGVIFEFYAFVVADHPTVPAFTALRRSAQLTRGVRLRLLGLAAVLVFLNLAGLFFCFVGLVVTYAVTALALAYTYRVLSGQVVAAL